MRPYKQVLEIREVVTLLLLHVHTAAIIYYTVSIKALISSSLSVATYVALSASPDETDSMNPPDIVGGTFTANKEEHEHNK